MRTKPAEAVDLGIPPRRSYGIRVDVDCEHRPVPEFRRGQRENSRTRPEVEQSRRPAWCQPLERQKTSPCRRMLARAEGHSGLDYERDSPSRRSAFGIAAPDRKASADLLLRKGRAHPREPALSCRRRAGRANGNAGCRGRDRECELERPLSIACLTHRFQEIRPAAGFEPRDAQRVRLERRAIDRDRRFRDGETKRFESVVTSCHHSSAGCFHDTTSAGRPHKGVTA